MVDKLCDKMCPTQYYCERCDFKCSKKWHWSRHLTSSKHINVDITISQCDKCVKCYKCICGKEYNHRQSLSLHKKKCNQPNINQEENVIIEQSHFIPPPIDLNLIMEVIKQNHDFKEMLFEQNKQMLEQVKQNQELQKQVLDIAKNSGNTTISNNINSNNKQFNLQFFLNETCKDAMNITEFINSLKLQLDDLEYTGDNGYVAGVSKIFLQELNQLDVCKRPIHCSDIKREIFHIKNNENQWEKERVLLIKMIKQITTQNIILLTTWREAHPGCEGYYHKLNDRYLKITGEALGSADDVVELRNFNKIIANVAKATLIDKHNF